MSLAEFVEYFEDNEEEEESIFGFMCMNVNKTE